MAINANGQIEFANEKEIEEKPPLIENQSDGEEHTPGVLTLVTNRALNAEVKVEVDQRQRINIFYTRCCVRDKVCSLIVDGGSCMNFVSTILVGKLALPTIDHWSPYTIHWFTTYVGRKITKQVPVAFCIRKYENELLYDVVSMHASHILLGRPWQFDKRVYYSRLSNSYSSKHKGRKIALTPLTPQ